MLKQVARGGIDDLHTWNPPTLIFIADERLALFREKVAERGLASRQIVRTPGWTAFAVAKTPGALCRT